MRGVVGTNAPSQIRLIKGSHIIVPRLFEHDRAYILQNADGRIVFAIPYEGDFTLIGTTDEDYDGDPAAVAAEESEIVYLCDAASEYFRTPVRRESVVRTYSGVRPLYDDGAPSAREVTRDYVLALDAPEGMAPLLNVFGGKITTYRRLSEHALDLLKPHLKTGEPWTAGAPLPGGDFPLDGVEDLIRSLTVVHPFLEKNHLRRLVRAYGTRTTEILNGARSYGDLGRSFGADLTEAEVSYLAQNEWAETADDILWRRSKLGLRVGGEHKAAIDDFLRTRQAPRPAMASPAP
jgi:glycerol-3-phosphate dehydrogenase